MEGTKKLFIENYPSTDSSEKSKIWFLGCPSLYCLPISDVTLSSDSLPTTINVKGYDGSIESKIQIEDVSYVYDKSISPQLKITISGTKTYGANSSSYDMIGYKLYDSKGYLVDSGNIYLSSLKER